MAETEVATKRYLVVGGDTLLGREIQEVLDGRSRQKVITYAATGEGNFGENEGEAAYFAPLDETAFNGADAVVVAGTPQGAEKAYHLGSALNGSVPVIDCTGYLRDREEAFLAAPLLREPEIRGEWLLVLAHPAAMAIATVLRRLDTKVGIKHVVAHVFEPASERGKGGVSELHQQTTNLLSFKPIDREVFGSQLGFNLLPQYGVEAPGSLSEVETRIRTELKTLLAPQHHTFGVPSVRLIQAPVFHGYSISLWVEFAVAFDVDELRGALASAQIDVRQPGEEQPNSVAAANQSGLVAGDIRKDDSDRNSAWFWIVGDNLRLLADAAADVLRAVRTRDLSR